jgi:PPP family 3-phenylpropionic acid transporter
VKPGLSLALLYGGIFGVLGIQLPFWPVYLQAKGLGDVAIGWLLAAPYLVKIVSNPLAGHWVDMRGERTLPLQCLAALALAATLFFLASNDFLPLLLLSLVAGGASAALIPLADNLTLTASRGMALDYGRIRLWGSISFIVTSFLVGELLTVAPSQSILWTTLAGMALCLIVTLRWLPALPAAPAARGDGFSLRALLRGASFPSFLGAASLIQLSHVIYYGFATLHWRGAGLSNGLIGLLWAEGVIVEVILFAAGSWILRFVTPRQLLFSAGAAGAVRWTVLACTTDPWVLALVQGLHALTYAACHLGAMQFIHASVPPGSSARAQGVYTAVTSGVVPGLAMLGSGALYQSLGGLAFLPMAAAAAFSLPLIWRLGAEHKKAQANY